MRWSNRNDDDNLKELLHGEDGSRLGTALAKMREHAPEAPAELRERVRAIATEKLPEQEAPPRRRFATRLSPARMGALAAAVLVVAIAIPAIAAFTRDGTLSQTGDAGSSEASGDAGGGGTPQPRPQLPLGAVDERARSALTAPASPPPPAAAGPRGDFVAPKVKAAAAPIPSTRRAQDYTARIKLHVNDHDELSKAVQSAIRSTRELGGYVTYVDYGTSGRKDGGAELSVRVPVGRVQTAIARFSGLGTILEQQTEIRDLQGQIDRITRDIQQRRDRIAKLEAQLKDPTLSDAERDRLEARVVRAKRGLANATGTRAGVIRQSRFAKLDLAFTTEKRSEPAPPPSDLRQLLDDAVGVLAMELAVVLYVLIAGAPFIALALLVLFGARALRRGANSRVLERA
jgi:hypothetical protein